MGLEWAGRAIENIGFIEVLQNVTTSKDYAFTVLHTSQITIDALGLLSLSPFSLAVAW
jgi:hypothetical protein